MVGHNSNGPRHAMQRHATPCNAMQRHATPCHEAWGAGGDDEASSSGAAGLVGGLMAFAGVLAVAVIYIEVGARSR